MSTTTTVKKHHFDEKFEFDAPRWHDFTQQEVVDERELRGEHEDPW